MLRVERDGNQTLVHVNSSSLSLIQTCARKARYVLHDRWLSKAGSPPLIYGLAIHKALEVFYAHSMRSRTMPRDFDEVAPLMAHGHSAPEPHFLYDAIAAFVAAGEPLRMLPDTDKRSLTAGIWVLTHYFKTYLNDVYVIHSDTAGPMVERSFSTPFYEDDRLRINIFGTVDFILRNEVSGEILTGDHKTTSQLGNDFLNRIKPNHQYTGYLVGASKVFGISGTNFLVNGIQVKARPMTARGGPPTFTRQITTRNETDFIEFRDVILEATRNYLRWEATNTWPLGTVDACANYGGCGYLDVCQAPTALRQNIMEAKFTRSTT